MANTPMSYGLDTAVPTPPPSSVPSTVASPLPQTRRNPLKPGGAKEGALIRFLDSGILRIKRRWAKRRFSDQDADEVKGYSGFKEAGKDIDELIDLVWASGTPNIQISYLLSLSFLIIEFLPGFPPAPRTTFNLLEKLDHAFSALLCGKDLDTDEPLPGCEDGSKVSITQKVRVRSVVERTRYAVVQLMSSDHTEGNDEAEEDDDDEDYNMDDTDDDDDEAADEEEDTTWHMDIGRVYERTLAQLGDELGGSPIGIITEDEGDIARRMETGILTGEEDGMTTGEEDGAMTDAEEY